MNDRLDLERAVQAAWSEAGQPMASLQAADRAFQELTGHMLFTVTRIMSGGTEIERLYSTVPEVYAVGGRKPIELATWSDTDEGAQSPFLGRTPAEFKDVFPDHAEITALGIGSVINLPVVFNGRVLGSVNLHDREWAYDEKHLVPGMKLARQLVPALLWDGVKRTQVR